MITLGFKSDDKTQEGLVREEWKTPVRTSRASIVFGIRN